LGAGADMTRVTLGKSRVRESRLPGSVRAKGKWLSYSATIQFKNVSKQMSQNRSRALILS
jgi:hypothetical protein